MQISFPREILEFKIDGIISYSDQKEVRRVRHNKSGEWFALTLRRKNFLFLGLEEGSLERARQLVHPGITQVFRAFEDNKSIYVLEELFYGQEVLEFMVHQQCSEDSLADITTQVLEALLYLQARHLFHPELQPERILVDEDQGRLVVKLSNELTFRRHSAYQRGGRTSVYDPPQLCSGRSLTIEGNVWQLGVLLYTMICGVNPFTLQDVAKKSFKTKAILDRPELKDISAEGFQFLRLVLACEPKERPSCKALLGHPWLTRPKRSPQTRLPENKASSIKMAFLSSKCSSALIQYIDEAVALAQDERRMRDVFSKIDKEGRGKLTKPQLSAGLIEYDAKETNLFLLGILLKNFSEGSESYDFGEFIRLFFNTRTVTLQSKLEMLFGFMDYHGEGEVDLEEVLDMVEDMQYVEETWRHVFPERRPGAKINYQTFHKLVEGFVNSVICAKL